VLALWAEVLYFTELSQSDKPIFTEQVFRCASAACFVGTDGTFLVAIVVTYTRFIDLTSNKFIGYKHYSRLIHSIQ